MQQITIYDIAKEAGVSSATVSRAISGNGYVSSVKKAAIMQLVDKYNFRPNTFAQSLKAGFTKTIGFIVPHIGNMYFANVYYEFEKRAVEHGYLTMLLNSNGDHETESKLLQSLMFKNVDGIVMMGGRVDAVSVEEQYIKELQDFSQQQPVILCGSRAERFGCSGVYTDDNRGVELLLEHLKEKGCRSVCFIGGSDKFYPSYDKKMSAYNYGEKLGLDVKVRWITKVDMYNYNAGYESMKQMIMENDIPDAICGVNDYVTAGALRAAVQVGFRIPEHILFAGFDNVDICELQTPPLTSVSPRYDSFGKKTFQSLEKLIHGKEMSRTTTFVRPEVIVRESTAQKKFSLIEQ